MLTGSDAGPEREGAFIPQRPRPPGFVLQCAPPCGDIILQKQPLLMPQEQVSTAAI